MAKAAMQSGDNPTPPAAPPRPASQPTVRRTLTAAPTPPAATSDVPSESDAARPAAPPTSPASLLSPSQSSKLESIALDILHELRRRHDQPPTDFSVTKLMAGITQVLVLAMLFVAFLNRATPHLNSILLFALTLQTMTIALLIMQRQR